MPRRVLCILALVLSVGAGATQAATPAQEADAALDRALRRLLAAPAGPHGVIAIVQRGARMKAHRFGVADLATGRKPRANDHMRIASVSKAFSGATALSLVGEGRLSLDDTIGERLPSLPAAWGAVTLRQLLDHTSGVPDYAANPAAQEAIGASPTVALPPSQLLDFVSGEPLRFEPGSRYEYSNSDNLIVALMVEAATGTTYDQALQEQVLDPLGLTRTSLPSGTEIASPFIHGYADAGRGEAAEDVSHALAAGWAWASGGIVSTPADLNRFVRGYVGGRLFDAATRAQQRRLVAGGTSEPPGPGRNDAGLAVFRYETRCGTVWGHTGSFPGYTQFAAASPDGSRSVTVSVNEQLTTRQSPAALALLRRAQALAVCAALAGR